MTLLNDHNYLSFIIPSVSAAQRYIFISTFKAEWKANQNCQQLGVFWETILKKAHADVRINLLLNFHLSKARIAKSNALLAKKLFHHNIDIRYLPANRCVHAKIILIDDKMAALGSHNLSTASHCRNFEMSYFTESRATVNAIKEICSKIWATAVKFKK